MNKHTKKPDPIMINLMSKIGLTWVKGKGFIPQHVAQRLKELDALEKFTRETRKQ